MQVIVQSDWKRKSTHFYQMFHMQAALSSSHKPIFTAVDVSFSHTLAATLKKLVSINAFN